MLHDQILAQVSQSLSRRFAPIKNGNDGGGSESKNPQPRANCHIWASSQPSKPGSHYSYITAKKRCEDPKLAEFVSSRFMGPRLGSSQLERSWLVNRWQKQARKGNSEREFGVSGRLVEPMQKCQWDQKEERQWLQRLTATTTEKVPFDDEECQEQCWPSVHRRDLFALLLAPRSRHCSGATVERPGSVPLSM